MSKKLVSLLSLLVLTALATPGFAEIKPGMFYIGPYIGGYTFDGTQHLETMPVYGLRAGYNLTKNVGLEGVFDYGHAKITKSQFHAFGTTDGVDVITYGVDALYHFMPEKQFVPFLAAGFRGNQLDYPPGTKTERSGIFDYGFGAHYFVKEALALRGDVRGLYLFDYGRSNVEYTVGLSYFFGFKPAPAPVVCPPAAPAPPPPPPAPAPKVEPPPPPPPAPKAEPKREKYCIVLKIEFDFDKADIKPKYHDEVGKVAAFMKKYPETSGVIDGHTDSRGTMAYNQKLSERRANSVKNYLVKQYGIDSKRLTSKGYGETKPIATNKTDEGRQLNRRIEANFDCVYITVEEK